MSDILTRLVTRINVNDDGCWEYNWARDANGYGRIGWQNRTWLAHRAAYALLVGPIPEGAHICHVCDNPPCCNPDHLFIGDAKSNLADMAAKGRARNQNSGKTHCRNGHEFTEENTYVDPLGKRNCRVCLRVKDKRYKDAHRELVRARSREWKARRRAELEAAS